MNFIKNDLSVYKKVMGEFGSKEPVVNEIKSGTFSEPIRKRSLINKIYKKIKEIVLFVCLNLKMEKRLKF